MLISLFVGLLSITSMVYSAPVDGCDKQAQILDLSISNCDAMGFREVCLTYDETLSSIKDGSISHSCSGIGGSKDKGGSEDWYSGVSMCQFVVGGESAWFGVKDGSGCKNAGVYELHDSQVGTCSGPGNFCEGKNDKECGWKFETLQCDEQPPECPDENVCEVFIPCEDVDNCPCTELKFVY